MINKITQPLVGCGLVALSGVLVSVLMWSKPVALGVAVGGLWNLLNLWCLMQLLRTWVEKRNPLQSSANRWARFWDRPWAWMLIKFPFLYGSIILLFMKTSLSLIGFGIGFTTILLVAVGVHLWVAHKEVSLTNVS